VIGRHGYGNRQAESAVPVASLTKAIVGTCVAQLIDTGKLRLEDRMADVLKAVFAGAGEPADPRFSSVTLAHLLSNRSGFTARENMTVGQGLIRHLQRYSAREKRSAELIASLPSIKLDFAPGERYHYQNINWLALGLVVEAVTGRPFEDYCWETVLQPLGLGKSGLNPDWQVMAGYGGWLISAQDYATFAANAVSTIRKRNGPAWAWMQQRADKQHDPADTAPNALYYAFGMNMRAQPDGSISAFHSGSWNMTARGVRDGELYGLFGSYFVAFGNGVTYVATYDGVPKVGVSLDRAMGAAARGAP
jgi:CubicO group peptidase (beta-lactamase class C family)